MVVEGFNDVIGLDAIGIPAVGIMSNCMTKGQVEKVSRWAKQLAEGKVFLLFDCEQSGDDGAKEALWLLTQRGLRVRLGWTQTMHNGEFEGRQPESLTRDEWEQVTSQRLFNDLGDAIAASRRASGHEHTGTRVES